MVSDSQEFMTEFFAIRSPLLPVSEWRDWGGKELADSVTPSAYERSLRAARNRLKKSCDEIIKEAVYLSSRSLAQKLSKAGKDPVNFESISNNVARYYARMAARSTPFGLFAGMGLGIISDAGETRISLPPSGHWKKNVRPSFEIPFGIIDGLARDRRFRRHVKFVSNPTIYEIGSYFRYYKGRAGDLVLSSVKKTSTLATILNWCRHRGLNFREILEKLGAGGADLKEAEAYLEELVAEQLLVPDIPIPRAEKESWRDWGKNLPEPWMGKRLVRALTDLEKLNAAPLGASIEKYEKVREIFTGLFLETSGKDAVNFEVFHADLWKTHEAGTLSSGHVSAILRTARLLHELIPHAEIKALANFKNWFIERFGDREIPLLEAMDPETGCIFEEAPPITTIPLPDDFVSFLAENIGNAKKDGRREILFEEKDLEPFKQKAGPLPDSFFAAVSLGRTLQGGAEATEISFKIATGPPGTGLLGRFCGRNPALSEVVRRLHRLEQERNPQALFAEIVNFPDGKVANISTRPPLRDFEIRISQLGFRDSAGRSIPLKDLHVSVRDGRVILRSKTLQKEIILRMASPHAFWRSKDPLYMFLGGLQKQPPLLATWSWGPFVNMVFLPRVKISGIVVSPATWHFSPRDFKALYSKKEGAYEQFRALKTLRKEFGLPRHVQFSAAIGDDPLLVDLENPLSVSAALSLLKTDRGPCRFQEVQPDFPSQEEMTGGYLNEIIVPFVSKKRSVTGREGVAEEKTTPIPRVSPPPRTFVPGSEWIYFKIYGGRVGIDRILVEDFFPYLRKIKKEGRIKKWFFLYFQDPQFHVRIRLLRPDHGPHSFGTLARVLDWTSSKFEKWKRQQLSWRYELGTYEREIERYGGPLAIGEAEEIFHHDSEAGSRVLQELTSRNGDFELRFLSTWLGLDMLVEDFFPDATAAHEFLEKMIEKCSGGDSFSHGSRRQWLNAGYRRRRDLLESLRARTFSPESFWGRIQSIHRARSQALRAPLKQLRDFDLTRRLSRPLADIYSSLTHVSVNRSLAQTGDAELDLYWALRLCRHSELAKKRF